MNRSPFLVRLAPRLRGPRLRTPLLFPEGRIRPRPVGDLALHPPESRSRRHLPLGGGVEVEQLRRYRRSDADAAGPRLSSWILDYFGRRDPERHRARFADFIRAGEAEARARRPGRG